MSELRKILRVFLASPGDLQEERTAVRDAVAEFNGSLAEHFGYQIQLDGWEDTIAGSGRPQSRINQEVDQCELFIGMIWKRWGTPPALDGRFTSGFEEEFERAKERYQETGRPEISLFFKNVPDDISEDPGDDLKKVLAFRKRMIAEKEFFFQEFTQPMDMAAWARKCFSTYVIGIKGEEQSSEPYEQRITSTDLGSEIDESENTNTENSPLSAAGFAFLETLVGKVGQEGAMETLTASEIARFRLLANSISKPGNEDKNMGVHDINILFSTWLDGMKLSKHEMNFLIRLGFQNLHNETVPLWCWVSTLSTSRRYAVILSSVFGTNDNEKIGAIRVMQALKLALPSGASLKLRETILASWFSEHSSARIKVAALAYLQRMGTAEDYAVADEEYRKNTHETARATLECMITIHLRTGPENSAQRLALEAAFESLDDDVLEAVLDKIENLDTDGLLPALEHRHALIRLKTLCILHARGALDQGTVEPLLTDSDPLVRDTAIAILKKWGRSFTENEVREILVQPQQQTPVGLSSVLPSGQSNRKGEALFKQYQIERLKRCSETVLTSTVKEEFVHLSPAYFARAEKYFGNYAEELRCHIDDRFVSYYDEVDRRMRLAFGHMSIGLELIETNEYAKEYTRKKLTREGLDILCRAGEREDLGRIRAYLRSRYVPASSADADYLRKQGGWSDILLLTSAEPPAMGGLLGVWPEFEDFQNAVPRAILRMARGYSVSNLLAQLAKRRHGLAIAASRHALGDG